mmetsp:Transcript_36269/g.104527  ORF Transcript_36269/g.104527 Transcript_36269/m.104527 type:complete len:112 (+) Transcript_36269:135-470(+)
MGAAAATTPRLRAGSKTQAKMPRQLMSHDHPRFHPETAVHDVDPTRGVRRPTPPQAPANHPARGNPHVRPRTVQQRGASWWRGQRRAAARGGQQKSWEGECEQRAKPSPWV